MTPSEAAAQLALLRAAYPDARTKVRPDTADLWLRTLRHLDSDVGAKAVQSLIAAVKFWPSIAELNEHVALVREQTRRERQAAKRDEEDLALDEMPRLELRDIPAVVEFRKQYLSPLPLDLTPDGTCDDECGRTGLRYQLGRVQVCADCARRRLRAADRIASAA